MRIAAFTPGKNVPSARFRVRQFVPHLASLGVELDEMRTATDAYPPVGRWQRPGWAALRLAELSAAAARSRRYDRVLLQREMVSSHVTLERFTGRPRLLDVDDAIHLLRGGGPARRLAQLCDRVIAGNAYLAEWYGRWNRDVVVLPTAVDADRYVPAIGTPPEEPGLTIGWIGTSANFPYLAEIEPALRRAMAARPELRLKIVSDRTPALASLDRARWSFVRWREDTEVADIQSMDIGIMPLADSDWARGKCSFKMLQYMACGLPVVVSPVGMNAEVLREAPVGLAASTEDQWVDALASLAAAPAMRAELGAAGRDTVVSRYSTREIAPQLARHLA